jgi:ribosomal protein S18 acetylase RimI-like enzyme
MGWGETTQALKSLESRSTDNKTVSTGLSPRSTALAKQTIAGGLFCRVSREDGDIVGIVDFVPRGHAGRSQYAYLALLMIAAPFREHGIGTAVIRAVEDEIRKDATVRCILSGVQVNNPDGMRFWQRNGYQIASGPELLPDQTTVFHLQKDIIQGWCRLRV